MSSGAERLEEGVLADAASAVMEAFRSFLGLLREANRDYLRDLIYRRDAPLDALAAVQVEEEEREAEFARRSEERVERAVRVSLRLPAERRPAAVAGALAQERNYARARSEAMFQRSLGSVERAVLERNSPLGAYWQIGYAEQHTPGCLVLHGKFWPWSVLRRVHPPRHHGCTSRLKSYGQALSEGLMGPGDVIPEAEAKRRAAGVMMEEEEELVQAILQEYRADQPRDRIGRWTDTGVGFSGGSLRSLFDGFQYAGLRTEVEDPPGENRHGASVRANVRNENGKLVGSVARVYRPPGFEGRAAFMEHDHAKLDPDYRGKGFMTALNAHAEEEYRRRGVGEIHLGAAHIGAYAWARAGFRPAEGAFKLMTWEDHPRRPGYRGTANRLQILREGGVSEQDITEMRRITETPGSTMEELIQVGIDRPFEADGVVTWPGKYLLTSTGVYWNGVKRLTPLAEAEAESLRDLHDEWVREGKLQDPDEGGGAEADREFWLEARRRGLVPGAARESDQEA